MYLCNGKDLARAAVYLLAYPGRGTGILASVLQAMQRAKTHFYEPGDWDLAASCRTLFSFDPNLPWLCMVG